jgi:hypothetical protein
LVRKLVSRTAGGFSLMTCDAQCNEELFTDSLTELYRHPRSLGMQELLAHHRNHLNASGKAFQTEDDPETATQELYDSRVDRMILEGELVHREEGWVGAPLRTGPGIALKVLGAWFH